MKAESKIKKESDIQKGFLKGNTVSLMMTFYPNSFDAKKVIADQKIKIKFEIDVDNPIGGKTELRYQYLPSPYEIQIFDAPTLFAGKICALLFRAYQNRLKGRDFYDYLFYVSRGTKINMTYLSNKIKNQINDRTNKEISLDELKSMLKAKFETVDYENAKLDVIHFINDIGKLRYWNKDFFLSTLDLLKKDN